jgi:hypothetical protein
MAVPKTQKLFGGGKMTTKDVIVSLFPQCDVAKLKEIEDSKLPADLLAMEDKLVETNYKFGVMYCKSGQTNEDEMFSNQHGSEDFNRFLECIGDRVRLKGFKGFRGGLDVREDTTGTESVVAKFRDMDIMFHVSTLLPYSTTNKQQISRKSHIGNDIGVVVFKEPGVPFDPACIVSQFPHYVIVVEPVPAHETDGDVLYRIACSRRTDVPAFGPYPQQKAYFPAQLSLREFIHAKCKTILVYA